MWEGAHAILICFEWASSPRFTAHWISCSVNCLSQYLLRHHIQKQNTQLSKAKQTTPLLLLIATGCSFHSCQREYLLLSGMVLSPIRDMAFSRASPRMSGWTPPNSPQDCSPRNYWEPNSAVGGQAVTSAGFLLPGFVEGREAVTCLTCSLHTSSYLHHSQRVLPALPSLLSPRDDLNTGQSGSSHLQTCRDTSCLLAVLPELEELDGLVERAQVCIHQLWVNR